MDVSTSLNIHYAFPGYNGKPFSAEESMKVVTEAGYKTLDFNFDSYCVNNEWMNTDSWKEHILSARELGDKLGVSWSQSHSRIYNWSGAIKDSRYEYENLLIKRSLKGASMLGCKTITMHPYQINDDVWYSRKKSMSVNIEEFKRYADILGDSKVKIAIENMIEAPQGPRRFCSSSEELNELLDALGDDERFGITWDTGHANITGVNQGEALRSFGSRLVALHINDNRSQRDDHLAPYYGTIDWDDVLKGLADVGYSGDFTFEIHKHTECISTSIRTSLLRFSYELGVDMVSKINKLKNPQGDTNGYH